MSEAQVLHRANGAPVSTSFRQAAFGEDDPFARHREIAWEGPDSMIAGRTRFIGELDVPGFPHTETIIVVEGELTLTADGAAPLVLGPQAGAVIGCGTVLRIQAQSGARFVFCATACDKPTQRGLFPLCAEADFKPSASLPPEALLSQPPQCRKDNVFTEDGMHYSAGIWDSTPYHRIVRPHRINEFMYLLDGSVRFATPDGSVLSLGTGDALFVPQGVQVGWESSDRVAKFYVTQSVQA
ncbi:cupin domain-containing protein [Pseudomonas trivialis]|uniref:cupin domain-containing protein n=1 Tax=Pseudomonas trivialis TaxID=200450 RepID=UPI0030D2A264